MKDLLHKQLKVGDLVAYAPGGSYAGVSIGEIVKFTPKRVHIKMTRGGRGRHITEENKYYAYSQEIIKLD